MNLHIAYFDTSTYRHIFEGYNISNEEKQLLFLKCADQELLIKVSLLNIEEIFSLYLKNREVGRKQLEQILKLADLSELLRYPDMMINDAFENLYNSRTEREYYIRDINILHRFKTILENPDGFEDKIQNIVLEISTQKDEFLLSNIDAKKEVLSKIGKEDWSKIEFNEFLKNSMPHFLRGFLDRIQNPNGKNEDELIEIISNNECVKIYSEACISLIFAQLFENMKPDRGDSFDLRHTVSAIPVELFVLDDKKFKRVLERIPSRKFKLFNLEEFIKIL